MAEILVAEDDAAIRSWVAYALEKDGFTVRAVADGDATLVAYAERRPDLLVLDVMMPRKSGFDVCAEIRRRDPRVPILMLSALGAEPDKVHGLGLGADDYLAKPFGLAEFRARVSALLRRAAAQGAPGADEFAFGDRRIDVARRVAVAPDGAEEALSQLELGILRMLAAHPGEVLSRDALLDAVWGVGYTGSTRTLDTRIASLRRKLGADGDRIESVYGAGYRYHAG